MDIIRQLLRRKNMEILLILVAIFLVIGIIGALFELVLEMLGSLVGIAILIGIVGLTFIIPYIMIPLLIFGYFYQKNRENKPEE